VLGPCAVGCVAFVLAGWLEWPAYVSVGVSPLGAHVSTSAA
jgi:hypothetical protein